MPQLQERWFDPPTIVVDEIEHPVCAVSETEDVSSPVDEAEATGV